MKRGAGVERNLEMVKEKKYAWGAKKCEKNQASE